MQIKQDFFSPTLIYECLMIQEVYDDAGWGQGGKSAMEIKFTVQCKRDCGPGAGNFVAKIFINFD